MSLKILFVLVSLCQSTLQMPSPPIETFQDKHDSVLGGLKSLNTDSSIGLTPGAAKIENHSANGNTAEAKVSPLGKIVDSIKAKGDTVGTKVHTVETKVHTVETKVDTVRTKVETVGTKVNTVGTKVDTVGTKVATVRTKQDHNGNLTSSESTENTTEAKEEEIEDILEEVEILGDFFPSIAKGELIVHDLIRRSSVDYQQAIDYDENLLDDVEKIVNPFYSYFVGRKRFKPIVVFGG